MLRKSRVLRTLEAAGRVRAGGVSYCAREYGPFAHSYRKRRARALVSELDGAAVPCSDHHAALCVRATALQPQTTGATACKYAFPARGAQGAVTSLPQGVRGRRLLVPNHTNAKRKLSTAYARSPHGVASPRRA